MEDSATDMTSVVTADDFFLATIALLKKHSVSILPVNDELDKKFSRLFSLVFEKQSDEVLPTFNFNVDEVHGNSRGFRETMYAARFNNIVSLENPTFHRMTIKLSEDDADYLSENSEIAELLSDHIVSVFADNITDAKLSN